MPQAWMHGFNSLQDFERQLLKHVARHGGILVICELHAFSQLISLVPLQPDALAQYAEQNCICIEPDRSDDEPPARSDDVLPAMSAPPVSTMHFGQPEAHFDASVQLCKSRQPFWQLSTSEALVHEPNCDELESHADWQFARSVVVPPLHATLLAHDFLQVSTADGPPHPTHATTAMHATDFILASPRSSPAPAARTSSPGRTCPGSSRRSLSACPRRSCRRRSPPCRSG